MTDALTIIFASLHGTVGFGPSISAVAEPAGVQRLTVYRHFPTERELVEACAAHFFASDPLPDFHAWSRIREPERRLRAALAETYARPRWGLRGCRHRLLAAAIAQRADEEAVDLMCRLVRGV